jgi:hypothetical protein
MCYSLTIESEIVVHVSFVGGAGMITSLPFHNSQI